MKSLGMRQYMPPSKASKQIRLLEEGQEKCKYCILNGLICRISDGFHLTAC